ncbi:zinc finger protein 592 [Protopterus annectens]|uniref:zinc finger protein 592 n=1 Tax=Protopterus annectens TaxID=7888 RepID=UPI001CFA50DE|nr:zinc finger protein 592 [Protopterus annectens]
MGDMKTPDFDDLLAAFDIPDATSLDAKEAIQSTSDETDGHLKPAGMCIEENLSVHHPVSVPDVPVVSVIVKNTSRQESVDATAEKDSSNLGSNILQNGFRGSDSDSRDTVHSFGKFESSFINGDNSRSYSEKVDLQKSENVSYSQFSPISSPEPEDAAKGNGVEEKQKHEERPYFPHAVYATSENSVIDGIPAQPEHELSMFDQYSKKDQKSESGTKKENAVEGSKIEQVKASGRLVEGKKDAARNSCPSQAVPSAEGSNPGEAKVEPLTDVKLCSSVPPRQRIKTARSKLSNCLAALVALQAKKVAEAAKEDFPNTASEPMPSLKEGGKGSPKMISKSPRSPRSPAEVVKKTKQPDSPRSVCSDSSGKASPSLAGGSPPAIPKVRIKTIKTASGEIKRTVTRIVTDSEQDEMDRSETSSVENVALEHCSPKLPNEPNPGDVVGNGKSMEPSKDAPGTPSHLSDETNSGLQAVGVSLDGSVQKQDTALLAVPSLSSNNTGGNVNVAQHSAGVQQAQSPGNAALLPKAVHLANLNLVPHSVAASVTAKSVSVRQNQPQLTTQVVYSSVPLVHQVKKPAPVASGIVEAFNKLLNGANPVPVYSPNLNPPPESNISVPARGYHCLECGDSFALQKSLKQHYARRSVHLEVTCTHCSKTLLFFNKCSLLAHAREHKSKGFVMQCSQLLMKPVSVDQMFSSSSTATYVTVAPHASSLGSVSLAAVSKPVVTAQNNGTVTFPYSQPAMPLFTDPLRLTRHGQKCFECNTQVNDENVLAAHYQWVADENDGLTCQVCQMMLPNKCSYSAHQRIHAHKSPYCCPECGALCRSAYFQTHVKENCLHYARKVGFRCVHCGSVFLTLGLLKVHIQEKHCEVFHKCAYCPMAFKSSESTATHISTQHSTLENKASQVLYKCSCEAIFNKQKLLHQHFYENSKLLVSVFKCPQCQLVYTQKPLLMQHVKSVHGVPQNPEDLSSLQQRSETSSGNQVSAVQSKTTSSTAPSSNSKKNRPNVPKSEAKSRPKNTGWTCAECSEWIPDRETYVSHMKNHGWLMKRYPCRQCTRSFSCPNTLRKHTRITHEKKSYSCCYCTDEKQSFTTRLMLESHISEKHSTNNPDSSQVPKPDPSKVDHSDLPPEKDPDPEQDLPPKRTAETVQMEENTEDDIESTPAKKLRAHYRCGKCGFLTESSSEFQDHIPEHKPEKSGLQCLHCGLCFTSQVSLNRHLFIIHKQKGPDDEEEEGKQKEEQVLGTSKTSETGQENQTAETNITNAEDNGLRCKVCHKAFDTETARNAHMRSHAVPFLRSK